MSEDVTPGQKVKVTIEIRGPKKGPALRKILARLKQVGKTQGFKVGKAKKGRK